MMKPCVIEDQKAWDESRHKTEYFVKALAGKDLVLCLVSAAEYLGLCSCTMELMIYTLTKEECEREGLEITFDGDIWYTTVNQTINDRSVPLPLSGCTLLWPAFSLPVC